ncbi:MAG: hypothetical protein KC493_11150 [Bacteriovoracaceae bacterium]|nr:hypothetical protein [Bacteriovoracaceae bacterium]
MSKAYSTEYKCSINLIPPNKEISKSQFNKYIKQFSYKMKEGAPGKTSTLKDVSVFIWAKASKIHLAIQRKQKEGKPLKYQTSYRIDTADIKVKITPDIEVSCFTASAISKIKDKSTRKMLDKSISDSSDLYSYGSDVLFTTTTFLKFKYRQQNATGMMRPIVFQKGNLYTLDDNIKKDENWCIFNIEVKLNEDTFLQQNTKFKPHSVSKNSNNNTQTVYSYNFVDFSSGKKSYDTSRYSPFSFECSLGKNQGFKSEVIKEVTGGRIKIIPAI